MSCLNPQRVTALKGIPPLLSVLEFVCNHDLYDAFQVLSLEHNIQTLVKEQPKLWILFHITRIKFCVEMHLRSPQESVLTDKLDQMLQSLCYLTPKYQPDIIKKYFDINTEDNINNMNNTSYSSLFYKIHQEIKIQAILTCNKTPDIKKELLANNIKININKDDPLNFRHIDLNEDIPQNHEFEIIEILQALSAFIKKDKSQNDAIQNFIEKHSFNKFKIKLYDYLKDIKSIYCNQMIDLIYNTSLHLNKNAKENNKKYANTSHKQYLSQMHYYSKPKPKSKPISTSISKSKAYTNLNDYKIGMKCKVRIRQKNKNTEYIWRNAKVIQTNKSQIRVEIQDGASSGHMKISDISRIKPIETIEPIEIEKEIQDLISSESTTNDRRKSKRLNRSSNLSVQSANYERGRRFFEKHEDEALRAGIIKYKDLLNIKKKGVKGIWSKIKEDVQFAPKLTHRTPKMLYDRYRVYVKNGTVP